MPDLMPPPRKLVDRFGRKITYLRLSVTDRCDLRCTYCMAERMKFLPKSEVLTLEELEQVAVAFISRGVSKIRITGGEPLVRPGILGLFDRIGSNLGNGLNELTLTTNATQLDKYAKDLFAAGVRRANVSLDSRDPDNFKRISRTGDLTRVLQGIDSGLAAGLKLKINMVALKDTNEHEIPSMIEWAHSLGMDLTLIEVMPMGDTGSNRLDQFVPLTKIREVLENQWTLTDEQRPISNAGPASYVNIKETNGRVGFITPLTNNFCAGCNRVRVTCTGRIYMCLGQEDHIDLRSALRSDNNLDSALDRAIFAKPEKHEFEISSSSVSTGTMRLMSTTGG